MNTENLKIVSFHPHKYLCQQRGENKNGWLKADLSLSEAMWIYAGY